MRSALAVASVVMLVACSHQGELTYERVLDGGASYSAYLVSYEHAGLKLHAMIAVPGTEQPEPGYPVVIANHGYVPDPAKYGITAEGVDSRPGDYYRSVPELYASRGFLVVMPDYRGHNSSEGIEFVHGKESVGYYAEDVVSLMSALHEIENADLERVFMWGHSMGGAVSMRVLLATDVVKATSFWSTMPVDDLADRVDELSAPLLIQHSVGDRSTAISNSKRLVQSLKSANHPHTFHTYPGAEHYFDGATRQRAADRDVEFFDSLLR